MSWGLHAPFQGAKEVAQPKPAGPTGWSRRNWVGPEPQRLEAQQGKVEARRQTGQTWVFEGVGQWEEGREEQPKRIELRRLLEAELAKSFSILATKNIINLISVLNIW